MSSSKILAVLPLLLLLTPFIPANAAAKLVPPKWSYHPENTRRIDDPNEVSTVLQRIETASDDYQTLGLREGVTLEDLRSQLVLLLNTFSSHHAHEKILSAYMSVLKKEIVHHATPGEPGANEVLISDEVGTWRIFKDARTGMILAKCRPHGIKPIKSLAELTPAELQERESILEFFRRDVNGRALEYSDIFAAKLLGKDIVDKNPFCQWGLQPPRLLN